MKVNSFKLKDGIAKEELIKAGFKTGSWRRQDGPDTLSISLPIHDSIVMDIFVEPGKNFDDFENIEVLDEDFLQHYSTFYLYFKKDVSESTPFVQKVITNYNEIMLSLGIFETIKEEEPRT